MKDTPLDAGSSENQDNLNPATVSAYKPIEGSPMGVLPTSFGWVALHGGLAPPGLRATYKNLFSIWEINALLWNPRHCRINQLGPLTWQRLRVLRPSTLLCAAVASLAAYLVSTSVSLAERRVALVVANAQYKDASLVLQNPMNDGADVANTLRELGFEVVLSSDVNKRQFDMSLQTFSRLAAGAQLRAFLLCGSCIAISRAQLSPTDRRRAGR